MKGENMSTASEEYFYPDVRFKKSNTIINARYSASLLEQKMLALSLAGAKKCDGRIEAHLSVNQVRKLMDKGYKSFYSSLKTAGVNLSRLQIMTESPEDHSWTVENLFKKVTSTNGDFTAVFNDDFEDNILNLQSSYTVLEIPTLAKFNKMASIRLYETLKSKCFYPRNYAGARDGRYMIVMSVDELRCLMGACDLTHPKIVNIFDNSKGIDYAKVLETARKIAEEDSGKDIPTKDKYKKPKWEDWYEFKRSALEPAIAEINELSKDNNDVNDILVHYEPDTSGAGGKVTTIKFFIIDTSYIKNAPEVEADVDIDDLVDEIRDLFNVKITTKEIKTILAEAHNDIEVVKKAYDVVSKMDCNNFVAAMISAIRQDWQPAVKSKKKRTTSFDGREYDWDKLEAELFGGNKAANY